MPLLKGNSKDVIAANIAELRKSGRGEKQSIAIAYSVAGKTKDTKRKAPHATKNLGKFHHPKK